jgi:hypothetical protein
MWRTIFKRKDLNTWRRMRLDESDHKYDEEFCQREGGMNG